MKVESWKKLRPLPLKLPEMQNKNTGFIKIHGWRTFSKFIASAMVRKTGDIFIGQTGDFDLCSKPGGFPGDFPWVTDFSHFVQVMGAAARSGSHKEAKMGAAMGGEISVLRYTKSPPTQCGLNLRMEFLKLCIKVSCFVEDFPDKLHCSHRMEKKHDQSIAI